MPYYLLIKFFYLLGITTPIFSLFSIIIILCSSNNQQQDALNQAEQQHVSRASFSPYFAFHSLDQQYLTDHSPISSIHLSYLHDNLALTHPSIAADIPFSHLKYKSIIQHMVEPKIMRAKMIKNDNADSLIITLLLLHRTNTILSYHNAHARYKSHNSALDNVTIYKHWQQDCTTPYCNLIYQLSITTPCAMHQQMADQSIINDQLSQEKFDQIIKNLMTPKLSFGFALEF